MEPVGPAAVSHGRRSDRCNAGGRQPGLGPGGGRVHGRLAAPGASCGAPRCHLTTAGSPTPRPFPLSVTGSTVIAEALTSIGDSTGLVALNRSDGSVLWQNNSLVGPAATFGSLMWSVARVNAKFLQGVAFVATSGRRAGGTPGFPAGEFGALAPVVNGSQVYVVSAGKLTCFTLPTTG